MSGQWAIKADSEKNGIMFLKQRDKKGSATVEAAIVLPFFLIALFTLAYIIRIFFAYNAMQSSLQNVARDISSASYFYYVSGLKDLSDKLDNLGQEASDEFSSQKDTIVASVDSFNNLIASVDTGQVAQPADIGGEIKKIQNMYQSGQDFAGNAEDAIKLVKEIIKDPKAEGKLILTVFAQKAAYIVQKELVCLIAECMLDSELEKKALIGVDAKQMLGISNMSFSQSQVFGDQESLEFIITYTVRPPGIFGLIPEMTLSNRVKLIAWTGGRGQSVRAGKEEEKPADEISLWNQMDNDKKYFDRGLEIEKSEINKLMLSSKSMGLEFMATDGMFPKVDAFIYDDNMVEAYDIFTLNPFMKSYKAQPSKIKAEIKQHGKRLMEFDFDDYPDEVPQSPNKKRIVICIAPDNASDVTDFDKYCQEAKTELEQLGISEVRFFKSYGKYTETVESQEEAPP